MSVWMCKGTGVCHWLGFLFQLEMHRALIYKGSATRHIRLVKSFGNFTMYNAIVFMGTPIYTFFKKRSKLVSALKR